MSTALLNSRGQSLMEVLFAIAIATVGIATIGYVLIDTSESFHLQQESIQASLLAYEGIAVVSLLRDRDFDELESDSFGLVSSDGEWSLGGEPDTTGMFERTLTLTEGEEGTFEIESSVVWPISATREGSVSLRTQLTDWKQTGGEAGDIVVGREEVSQNESTIAPIEVRNEGVEARTLSDMRLLWEGSARLTRVEIGGEEVFAVASSSPGITSGAGIDIADYELGALDAGAVSLSFDEPVSGDELVVTFLLPDGSAKYARLAF